jgi:hypothetical protein
LAAKKREPRYSPKRVVETLRGGGIQVLSIQDDDARRRCTERRAYSLRTHRDRGEFRRRL